MLKMCERITAKLKAAFNPDFFEVIDESAQHAAGLWKESHFKVVIVTDFFEGKKSLARHRAVYSALQEELNDGVHALALHTYTTEEWDNIDNVPDSPVCAGRRK